MLSLELLWPQIQPLLWCATFASSSVYFTFFQLPFLVRARSPHDTWASGVGIHPPSYVMSHDTPLESRTPSIQGGSKAINLPWVMQSILNAELSTSFSPSWGFGECALLFFGTPTLHAVTDSLVFLPHLSRSLLWHSGLPAQRLTFIPLAIVCLSVVPFIGLKVPWG